MSKTEDRKKRKKKDKKKEKKKRKVSDDNEAKKEKKRQKKARETPSPTEGTAVDDNKAKDISKKPSLETKETKNPVNKKAAAKEISKEDFQSKENGSSEAKAPPDDASPLEMAHRDPRIVLHSALDNSTYDPTQEIEDGGGVSLLLFYQYVEPPWDENHYQFVLKELQRWGDELSLTGRMRVSREGLNCTITAPSLVQLVQYCLRLRTWPHFERTEFKISFQLPQQQRFPALKVIPVIELVHYGLEGKKAPSIAQYEGTHLEPRDYHQKLAESDTVVIDVRNHYEAAIGRFCPPNSQYVDPKMRKSTEFPVWLDKPETKDMLKGKQVLMYCTGGVRCERATALLKYKMDKDEEVAQLGIKGVYQLQGGIDKYFREFPDGGYWKGKNYVFDKRFAHGPVNPAAKENGSSPQQKKEEHKNEPEIMGNCQVCQKPWDMYRGKQRCPTCGVPSLICRYCLSQKGKRVQQQCDLCVEQEVRSKAELRKKEEAELQDYEQRYSEKGLLVLDNKQAPNPNKVTRLFLKNMCKKNMTEEILMKTLPGITHIVWRTDRKTGNFFGQGWVEMATPEDASRAMSKNGTVVLGRPLYISYQPPDGKDAWPPPNSMVQKHHL